MGTKERVCGDWFCFARTQWLQQELPNRASLDSFLGGAVCRSWILSRWRDQMRAASDFCAAKPVTAELGYTGPPDSCLWRMFYLKVCVREISVNSSQTPSSFSWQKQRVRLELISGVVQVNWAALPEAGPDGNKGLVTRHKHRPDGEGGVDAIRPSSRHRDEDHFCKLLKRCCLILVCLFGEAESGWWVSLPR